MRHIQRKILFAAALSSAALFLYPPHPVQANDTNIAMEEITLMPEEQHNNTREGKDDQVFSDYRALALANWDILTTAQKLKASHVSQKTDMILLVIGHNLTQWVKQKDGSWQKILDVYCGYGRNGLSSDRHEGDGTTPTGAFPILHAFGTAKDVETSMTFVPVTPYSYWSDEGDTYNTWVESKVPVSGEHLIDYYQYSYACAIGFNCDPAVPGKGSAIFLHCKSENTWKTSGCVSVTKEDMITILKQIHDGAYIVIEPDEDALKND